MRIESIDLSKKVFEGMGIGLATLPMEEKPLRMRDLGQCVVIAGKNGAGKTRLLDLLGELASRHVSDDERHQAEFNIVQNAATLQTHRGSLERIRDEGLRNGDPPGLAEEAQRAIAASMQEIERQQQIVAVSNAFVVRGTGRPKVVPFVPRTTQLTDPTSGHEQAAIQQAQQFAGGLAAKGAHAGAPAYARQTMRAAVGERGRRNPSGGNELQQAEDSLLDIIASFLGDEVRFELTDDLNLRLQGLHDRYDDLLSDGQKVLFQLACMLHARQASLTDCIVVLDEPENHLHPSVLNNVVDRLLDVLTDGQLWIATHSVPLIAHLVARDQNCLWFAEGGRFKPAGRTPETVLDSLLGGPDGARKVNELTLLPSRFASSVFLRQCLLPPNVIGYNGDDPQLTQIRAVLSGLKRDGKALSVVDFGSGKGRLLAQISREVEGEELSLRDLLDYTAYEPHAPDAQHCQQLASSLYGDPEVKQRAFSDLRELLEVRGGGFADIVVVCNVLHEVHPDQWLTEFGPSSALVELLHDDGYALFVEDYALPVGERAHEYGFLLLDQDQLSALFGVTLDDIEHQRFTRSDHLTPRYRGRLIAHLVSVRCLKRVTEDSVLRSIQSLHDQSLRRLKELLSKSDSMNSGSEHGRESALVTQLVANSALWLRDKSDSSAP